MTWNQIFDDTFARANGAVGNGWTDAASVWSIASDTLTTASSSFNTALLERPASEYSGVPNQQVSIKTTTGPTISTNNTPLLLLRLSGSPGSYTGYGCWVGYDGTSNTLNFGRYDAGSLGSIDATHTGSVPINTAIITTFSVVGSTFTCTVATAAAPGTPLITFTETDSTYSSGTTGLAALAPASGSNVVSEFTSYGYSGPLVFAGPLTLTANTPSGGVTVGYSAASGGASPVTYRLYRSAAPMSTATGTLVATGTGTTLTDATPLSTDSYYLATATDATPTTVTASQTSTQACLLVKPKAVTINIINIGDSITAGGYASDPTTTSFAALLPGLLAERFPQAIVNGNGTPSGGAPYLLNRAYPGTTSVDWVNTTNGANLAEALALIVEGQTNLFPIMLGVNDSKVAFATSAATYRSNIASIAAQIVAAGGIPVLFAPTWVVPGAGFTEPYTFPGTSPQDIWDETHTLPLLQAYRDSLPSICNNSTIYLGSTGLFDVTAAQVQSGVAISYDGVHYTDLGHALLARDQSAALIRVVATKTGLVPGGAATFNAIGCNFIKGAA